MSQNYNSRNSSPSRRFERPSPSQGNVHPSRSAVIHSRSDGAFEIPRGPKSFGEPSRNSSYSGPSPSRGRGFSARGDYRADFRERESLRFARDRSPVADERNTSWRSDDNRRSPPRARVAPGDFRNGPSRSFDTPRIRAISRERVPFGSGPPPSSRGISRENSYANRGDLYTGRGNPNNARGDSFVARRESYSDRMDARSNREGSHFGREDSDAGRGTFHPSRGDFNTGRADSYRGRSRGDWASSGRGRGSFYDDRTSYRPRSRSPRGDTWSRDSIRDDNQNQRFEDRRLDRRDDDRDERPREQELFSTQRPSMSSTSAVGLPGINQAIRSRPGSTHESDQPYQRRYSSAGMSASSRDGPTDKPRAPFISIQNDTPKDRFVQRGSSPVRAPEVPAFGSAVPWNVWKADVKSAKIQAPPTAAKALSALSIKPELVAPTAPKAERLAGQTLQVDRKQSNLSMREMRDSRELKNRRSQDFNPSMINSPGPRPRQFSNPPIGPRADARVERTAILSPAISRTDKISNSTVVTPRTTTGPAMSPVPMALSGSKTDNSVSVKTPFAVGVPTGPKADRAISQSTKAPTDLSSKASRPWQREGAMNGPPGLVPAKRDYDGQEKRKFSQDPTATSGGMVTSNEVSKAMENTAVKKEILQQSNSVEMPNPPELVMIESNTFDPPSDEDGMDLDERDFADNEAKFARSKARLEAQKVDLTSRRLRGSSPLEQLAVLCRLGLEDFSTFFQTKLTSRSREPNHAEINTESGYVDDQRNEEEMVTDRYSSPRTSPSPIGSPDLRSLPFLSQTPLTEFSELDSYQGHLSDHTSLKDTLATELRRQMNIRSVMEEEIREEYASLYLNWRESTNELDRQQREKEAKETHHLVDSTSAISADATSPTVLSSAVESRRARGTFSDYDLQKVMQESLETEREAQAKRDREASYARPDYEKEAIIPDLLPEVDQYSKKFWDTSCLMDSREATLNYRFLPLKDNFTREEHQLILTNWKDLPKKWGLLAQLLPGRTYKDCINHYYATKWDQGYKTAREKRTRKVVSSRPRGRGVAGKPRANALISNLDQVATDSYDGDISTPNAAMTETGRPRRAAAPTFTKESDDQLTPSATPGRRSMKNDNGEPGSEKAFRKMRGGTRERGSRRPKTQALRTRSMSPVKRNTSRSQGLDVRESLETEAALGFGIAQYQLDATNHDRVNGFTQLSAGRNSLIDESANHNSENYGQSLMTSNMLTRPTMGQQQKSGPSSYWSVSEINAFPELFATYGTDWHSIANAMGTKTTTMVRNYYGRTQNGPHARGDAVMDERRQRGEFITPTSTSQAYSNRQNDVKQLGATHSLALTNEEDASQATSEVIHTRNNDRPTSYGQYSSMLNVSGPSATSIQYLNTPHIEDIVYPPGSNITGGSSHQSSHSFRHRGNSQISKQMKFGISSQSPPDHEMSDARESSWKPNSDQDVYDAVVDSRSRISADEQMHVNYARVHSGQHSRNVSSVIVSPSRTRFDRDEKDSKQHSSYLPSYEVGQNSSSLRYRTDSQALRPHVASTIFEHDPPSSQSSIYREQTYGLPRPPTIANVPSVAPKQETRKTSNLMSILNAEPDEPVASARMPAASVQPSFPTRTPPYGSTMSSHPPPRPVSQPGRADLMRDPPRTSSYQPASYQTHSTQHLSAPTRDTLLTPGSSRVEWPPTSLFSQPAISSPSPFDRPPENALFNRRPLHFGHRAPSPRPLSPAPYSSQQNANQSQQHDPILSPRRPSNHPPPSLFGHRTNDFAYAHNAGVSRQRDRDATQHEVEARYGSEHELTHRVNERDRPNRDAERARETELVRAEEREREYRSSDMAYGPYDGAPGQRRSID